MTETPDIKMLAEQLSESDVKKIMLEQLGKKTEDLQVKIEKQSYAEDEILSRYSEYQYVEQKLEIDSLTLVLRSVPPVFEEEAMHYANKASDGNRLVYERIYMRRRLAYGLISVNGKPISGTGLSGSYFSAISADEKAFIENMKSRADKVIKYLDVNPMAFKISEIFAAWENVIYNRINGIEDLSSAVKKSTGGSEAEQSRG